MNATKHRNYNKSGDIIDDNDIDDYDDLLYMLMVVAPPPQRSKDIAAT